MARRKQVRPKSVLQLKVKGPHIRPGRIPIPELLVICEQAQQAIHRQAEALEGRKSLKPGPKSADVLEKCTLELFAIGKGSAVMSFAAPDLPPPPQRDMLDLPDLELPTLGETAVLAVVNSIDSIHRGNVDIVEKGVIRSFQGLGALLVNGVSSIEWIVPRGTGRKRTVALFDQEVRERVQERLEKPEPKLVTMEGILEMADFKPTDLKCLIHTEGDYRVPCTFTKDLSDDVYNALRHAARIHGVAMVNPRTKRPEEIELRSVAVLDPHLIDAESFFAGQGLQDLAKAQGITVGGRILPSEERESDEATDAFLAHIYGLRA
jgi:hypothetical protein